MNERDLTITLLVDQSRDEAFDAIKNVRGWWSEGLEGSTENLGDEFTYRHKELHESKQKLVERVPAERLVWLVLDANLSFTSNTAEWKGTYLRFDISRKAKKTEVRFTHIGLRPEHECFDACSRGWGFYVGKSLRALIASGKGEPDPKESARRPRAKQGDRSATS
jgi:hypothetical protein